MLTICLTENLRVEIFSAFSTSVNIVWIMRVCLATVTFCYVPDRTTIVTLNWTYSAGSLRWIVKCNNRYCACPYLFHAVNSSSPMRLNVSLPLLKWLRNSCYCPFIISDGYYFGGRKKSLLMSLFGLGHIYLKMVFNLQVSYIHVTVHRNRFIFK